MATTSSQEILAELDKLEKLAQSGASRSTKASKSSGAAVLIDTLTALEEALEQAQHEVEQGDIPLPLLAKNLASETDKRRAEVDKGLKEWYAGLSKVGKAIDKVCTPIAALPLFTESPPALAIYRTSTPSYWKYQRPMTIRLHYSPMMMRERP